MTITNALVHRFSSMTVEVDYSSTLHLLPAVLQHLAEVIKGLELRCRFDISILKNWERYVDLSLSPNAWGKLLITLETFIKTMRWYSTGGIVSVLHSRGFRYEFLRHSHNNRIDPLYSAPLPAKFFTWLHSLILRDILIQGLVALADTNLRTKSKKLPFLYNSPIWKGGDLSKEFLYRFFRDPQSSAEVPTFNACFFQRMFYNDGFASIAMTHASRIYSTIGLTFFQIQLILAGQSLPQIGWCRYWQRWAAVIPILKNL